MYIIFKREVASQAGSFKKIPNVLFMTQIPELVRNRLRKRITRLPTGRQALRGRNRKRLDDSSINNNCLARHIV